ncbi:MAG: NAD-dependent epimerase/dehydratase family protein [Sphingomonas sp.]|uniref:NAD-dependent epimerase/dehydratase family protein n=1 Tax=Sphingomonas sp. TaxID=28214 RepID=UPI003F7DADAD
MPRALVTGATGFVGRALTARLLAEGWDVAAMVRDPARLDPAVEAIAADLENPAGLRIDRGYDVLFHLAARLPSAEASDADFRACNVAATERLLDAAERAGVSRFVYMSSISVIGEPLSTPVGEGHPTTPNNPYSASKLTAERACIAAHQRGRSVVSLRLTSPYGPGMAKGTVLPFFVGRALKGEPLTWHGEGSRAQDFVHVDDVVAGCLAAAATPSPGALYNLASGKPTTMRALAETIAAQTGVSAASSGRPDPQDGVRWDISIDHARRELGYAPRVALADGLADYIASERGA